MLKKIPRMRADVLNPQQAAQKDLMGTAPFELLNGLNRFLRSETIGR